MMGDVLSGAGSQNTPLTVVASPTPPYPPFTMPFFVPWSLRVKQGTKPELGGRVAPAALL